MTVNAVIFRDIQIQKKILWFGRCGFGKQFQNHLPIAVVVLHRIARPEPLCRSILDVGDLLESVLGRFVAVGGIFRAGRIDLTLKRNGPLFFLLFGGDGPFNGMRIEGDGESHGLIFLFSDQAIAVRFFFDFEWNGSCGITQGINQITFSRYPVSGSGLDD